MTITAESTEKQDYRKNSSIDSPSIIVEHFPLENSNSVSPSSDRLQLNRSARFAGGAFKEPAK